MYKRITLIAALFFIFIFQVLPISVSGGVRNLDKVVHFFTYFFLTFLFIWNNFSLKKSLIFSLSYGVLMEVVQIPLPLRDFSFYDFLANCAGAFSFLGVYFYLRRFRRYE